MKLVEAYLLQVLHSPACRADGLGDGFRPYRSAGEAADEGDRAVDRQQPAGIWGRTAQLHGDRLAGRQTDFHDQTAAAEELHDVVDRRSCHAEVDVHAVETGEVQPWAGDIELGIGRAMGLVHRNQLAASGYMRLASRPGDDLQQAFAREQKAGLYVGTFWDRLFEQNPSEVDSGRVEP